MLLITFLKEFQKAARVFPIGFSTQKIKVTVCKRVFIYDQILNSGKHSVLQYWLGKQI